MAAPVTSHSASCRARVQDGQLIVSGGGGEGTVRVWRLADGTPVRKPLAGHDGPVRAVAVGALPDGTPVIVSGGGGVAGGEGTVRVWRLADGAPLLPPLELPAPVWHVAAHGDTIIAATGAGIAVHQPAPRDCSASSPQPPCYF